MEKPFLWFTFICIFLLQTLIKWEKIEKNSNSTLLLIMVWASSKKLWPHSTLLLEVFQRY